MVRSTRLRGSALVAAEAAAAVAAAPGACALLEHVASATSLGVVYMLAVLFVAIRSGEVPALGTAVASVLALNFFFIEPRHRLTIADPHSVVALGVFLIAALVVGRLAAASRARAHEAAERAAQATAREREATLLAEAASSLLAGAPTGSTPLGGRMDRALETAGARIELKHAPCPQSGEI